MKMPHLASIARRCVYRASRVDEMPKGGSRQARRFVHEGHTLWEVFELPTPRGEPSLVFQSEAAIRRVRDFPSGWRDLPEYELLLLSWNR